MMIIHSQIIRLDQLINGCILIQLMLLDIYKGKLIFSARKSSSKMEGVPVAVDAEPNWIKYSNPRHVPHMGIKASPVLW